MRPSRSGAGIGEVGEVGVCVTAVVKYYVLLFECVLEEDALAGG